MLQVNITFDEMSLSTLYEPHFQAFVYSWIISHACLDPIRECSTLLCLSTSLSVYYSFLFCYLLLKTTKPIHLPASPNRVANENDDDGDTKSSMNFLKQWNTFSKIPVWNFYNCKSDLFNNLLPANHVHIVNQILIPFQTCFLLITILVSSVCYCMFMYSSIVIIELPACD